MRDQVRPALGAGRCVLNAECWALGAKRLWAVVWRLQLQPFSQTFGHWTWSLFTISWSGYGDVG